MNLKLHKMVVEENEWNRNTKNVLGAVGEEDLNRSKRRERSESGGWPALLVGTPRRGVRFGGERGIALVVTLLMLSVITFLAIAFLAMSKRDQASVKTSLDSAAAKDMSDAALSRAQAEIVAQMMSRGDALSYDYMASHNYINPLGFTNKSQSTANVNYDYFYNTVNPVGLNPVAWAQNIANLFYDPRPPVFVPTNGPNGTVSNDFRFWVDINRNGRFETNGYLPYIREDGTTNGNYEYFNGEPEWIGVLRDPLNRHSATNFFIGRYAYMVLPIGKTLDFNYIHNWLKGMYSDKVSSLTNNFFANASESGENVQDGFARDAGMGSWEINLAALLQVLSPDAYQYGFPNYPFYPAPTPYQYFLPNGGGSSPNLGSAFADAESIVHYRYYPPYNVNNPASWTPTAAPTYFLGSLFQNGLTALTSNDVYCMVAPATNDYSPGTYTSDVQPVKNPWPGSYTTNMFYDPQDLFDASKTSGAFTNRLWLSGTRTNSDDRYMFQRLLANIGMGSQPEYGTWVFNENGQQELRTKVNINYDNTFQITNGPYTPMPTNLVPWKPVAFFTNAADLLLRSQTYNYIWTNYAIQGGRVVQTGVQTTNLYFGVSDIPIFRAYFPGIQYNEAVHRMLQVAANIYSTTIATNHNTANPTPLSQTLPPDVRHPFVFRPLFQVVGTPGLSNWGVNIVGFTNVPDSSTAMAQLRQPFIDLTSNNFAIDVANGAFSSNTINNYNFSGIPWVVSAEKGLPQFYQYTYDNRVLLTRKVLFVRGISGGEPDTNHPPVYTNQFYCMAVSNSFGATAWNPYTTPFSGSASASGGTYYYLSNFVTVTLTNNYNYGFTTNFSVVVDPSYTLQRAINWRAWSGNPTARNNTNGFVVLINTNIVTVPSSYFSEGSSPKQLLFFTNGLASSNSFRQVDMTQNGWPVHNWVLNVTNHLVYLLSDGAFSTKAGQTSGHAVLDLVNLGPFGSSVSITQQVTTLGGGNTPTLAGDPWAIGSATDLANSAKSAGLLNQINYGLTADSTYYNSLNGIAGPQYQGYVFGPDLNPSNSFVEQVNFVANDPFVHYTIGDLAWPQYGDTSLPIDVNSIALLYPVTNNAGRISIRYQPWGLQGETHFDDMLFADAGVTSASAWNFPTNQYPSIGWLGRVHRGTPWQTVYFKSDNPKGNTPPQDWITDWVNTFDTYPTNDWAIADLFTTAPNDNAARGLLSVNQTNDAAWAAVLSGVIALTNVNGGVPIDPTNVYAFVDAPTNGINYIRSTNVNGLFHKVGQILQVPTLTVASPFLNGIAPNLESDEVVERIPQQIMGLLKVGEPQFVIYGWGESLRPKTMYLGTPNTGLCTNYEITGEYLSRMVCHVVHTNLTPKIVVDSYNVEPSN
jgi:hypothetical protein